MGQLIPNDTLIEFTKLCHDQRAYAKQVFNICCLCGLILQMVIGIGVLSKGSGWVNLFQMILSLTSLSYTKTKELMPSKLFYICCLYGPILQMVIGIGVLFKGSGLVNLFQMIA